MIPARFLFPPLLLTLFLAAHVTPAREAKRTFYVDAAKGSDAHPGTSPQQAFQTISKAARVLRGGDKLIVGPGVYYEQPVFEEMKSSKEKPVWILARPRGGATISAVWKEAALGKVKWKDDGGGLYSAPRALPALFCWTEKRKFLPRYLKREHLVSGKVPTRGRQGVVNVPPYGFVFEKGRICVKLPGGQDPNGKPLMFSLPSWGEKTIRSGVIVRANNSPYIIFDGFRIQGTGTYGIVCGSPHAVVRNCVFEYCREGAGLASDSLVEWCEYAYPGFFDFAEETRKLNSGRIGVFPITKEYYPHNWWEGSLAYSTAGEQEPSPKHLEVRYSFMHQVFDGLEFGTFDDSEAHHNVFLHCYDNCVEMEAWQKAAHSRNLRFHHNLLLSCPGGPISHQFSSAKQTLEGPHYVYRNVVCGYDEHGWNPWVVIKSKCHDIKGLYYYHNLFWVKSAEPYWNEKKWPQEWLKKTAFKNNILVFTENLKRPTGPHGLEGLFQAAGNIVAAPRINEAIKKALLRSGGRFFTDPVKILLKDPGKLDFGLQAGSPAVDAGVKLPGFNDMFKGKAPDVGPFEAGETPGPDWPRPRKTLFNEAPPQAWTGKAAPPKLRAAP